jgi:NADPH-dependent 2,4-dienoyl-CoA reductase/sulfur reductase-like enzyme
MPDYTYFIVGGGMTATSAARGIREVDRDGSIGLLSSEAHPPYNRPPLSKGLWKGMPLKLVWRKTEGQGVTLHLGRTAQHLDPQNKRVTDDQETVYRYEKLLLATGGRPRRLPFGGDRIIYFRTLDDYQRLRAMTEQSQRFAVIGGGFIGSEIAAALAQNGKAVVMAFPEDGIGSRVFPADLAAFLNDFYRQKGVEVLAGSQVVGLEPRGDQLALDVKDVHSASAREIIADGVVAGIGIEPNVELARAAGLEVNNGIAVDRSLRTSNSDVFAAGDVACFANSALGMRLRVEHEDNCNTMGRLAGHAMAGKDVSYDHLPSFYSDLFELGYEAVGELDPHLETVADWKDPYRAGVVYYLKAGRVRGVLLWNIWRQADAARGLIAAPGPFQPEDLKGRLPA